MMFGIGKLRRERDQSRRDVEALRREMVEEVRKHSEAAAEVERLRQQLAAERGNRDAVRENVLKHLQGRLDEYREALFSIAEMETPSCAHIGKRMAARARQALPGGGPTIRLEPANPPVTAEVA